MCVHRVMQAFEAPRDIIRNPQALFRQFKPTENGDYPFDIYLKISGDNFAINEMIFKLGLYET